MMFHGIFARLFDSNQFMTHAFNWDRLKINCVVMNGVNTDELADFIDFTRDQELDVRFIEWMPFDDNRWKDAKFFSYKVCKVIGIFTTDLSFSEIVKLGYRNERHA